VFTDFRTLAVKPVPVPGETVFLLIDTGVKHRLVDSAYNNRRAACERAAAFFADRLEHPVNALRDVSMEKWRAASDDLEAEAAKRSAHVIGENERVLEGVDLLRAGEARSFGRLMFASHESSIHNFENSAPELDFLVERASALDGVFGARLSGGGFGGSVVALVEREGAADIGAALEAAYTERFGHSISARTITPSLGARVLNELRSERQ
jgi:galactokinase